MLETIQQAGWIAALVFVAAVVGISAWKSSQQYPVGNQEQPAEAENKNARQSQPKNMERETKQTTDNQDNHRNQKTRSTFAEHPTEWLLVLFNFFLVVFSGLLWWSTWGLWGAADEQSRDTKAAVQLSERSAKAAEDAAGAAQRNVDAIIEGERPHMLVEELSVSGIRQPADPNGNVIVHISGRLGNYGKTPAMLKAYSLVEFHGAALPQVPDYGVPVPLRFVLSVGGKYGSVKPSDWPIPHAIVQEVLSGHRNIIMYGMLEYEDPWGKLHKTRFAYRMIFGAGDASEQFFPDGPDAYWEYN